MISLLRITPENRQPFLERLLEIENRCYTVPWSADAFLQEIGNPIARLWTAQVNGRPAGFILYWVLDFEVNLLNLAVHPENRKKGVAKLLLNHMVEEATAKGVEALWLEVRVSNTGAIRLYERFGFEKAGLRRKYYDDTQEDAIVMCLALPDPRPAPCLSYPGSSPLEGERSAEGGSIRTPLRNDDSPSFIRRRT